MPPQFSNRLTCSLGKFPEELNFPKAFFDGISNAKLLHFFDDAQTRAGLAPFHSWLKPGGHLFSGMTPLCKLLFPAYEARLAAIEERWSMRAWLAYENSAAILLQARAATKRARHCRFVRTRTRSNLSNARETSCY